MKPQKIEGGLFEGDITREQAIIIGLGRDEDGQVDYTIEGVCLGEWLQRVITKMVSEAKASERQRCVENCDIIVCNVCSKKISKILKSPPLVKEKLRKSPKV